MNILIRLSLDATAEQFNRLDLLQRTFMDVCNAIAPVAQKNHCWNRVALHHLVYRSMREKFPAIGSQMICNAIYSVCRAYRVWDAATKVGITQAVNKKLPVLVFLPTAPVFFDRHTLSLKGNQLSIFTLDGRIQFSFKLNKMDQERLLISKVKEITLVRNSKKFELHFSLVDSKGESRGNASIVDELPKYIWVAPAEQSLKKVA